MVTAFANNQSMTAMSAAPSYIYTDPVSLGDNDRATINWNVHYLWASGGGGVATATYMVQVSNDGVYWINPAVTDFTTAPSAGVPRQKVGLVHGEFIRFEVKLECTDSSLAGMAFDLHVKLDHA